MAKWSEDRYPGPPTETLKWGMVKWGQTIGTVKVIGTGSSKLVKKSGPGDHVSIKTDLKR